MGNSWDQQPVDWWGRKAMAAKTFEMYSYNSQLLNVIPKSFYVRTWSLPTWLREKMEKEISRCHPPTLYQSMVTAIG